MHWHEVGAGVVGHYQLTNVNIIAYCDERFEQATQEAVGRDAFVLVSPPVTDENVRALARQFARADVVWFDFHMPSADLQFWVNGGGQVALSPETLSAFDLSRAVVFVVNCYHGGDVMLAALRATKARAIVGGEGENFAGTNHMAGADILGREFLRSLSVMPQTPTTALRFAKLRLTAMAQTQSIRDALEFKIL